MYNSVLECFKSIARLSDSKQQLCCCGRLVFPYSGKEGLKGLRSITVLCYVMLCYLILSLSRSLADRWATTVDFTTSFINSWRFSAFHSMIFHSRPVHSLMLSSHRYLCLPLRLPPFTITVTTGILDFYEDCCAE